MVDDPDAPGGTWVHWVLYNIPPTQSRLPEGIPHVPTLPDGICQGRNDFGRIGWGGPTPPNGVHHYHFHLYALDQILSIKAQPTRTQLNLAMAHHVLARALLVGTYTRR